jgi:hypothetical protein
VPGLLRDLAAEVGVEEPAILEDALRTIGLDASAGGPVPAALLRLDVTMSGPLGRPHAVGELLRLDPYGSWDDIAAKPRGETGRALLEVLRAVKDSGDALRTAIQADYRREADAALLGLDLGVTRKV